MGAPLRLKLLLLRGTHYAPLSHPLLSLLLHTAWLRQRDRLPAAER